MKFRNLLIIFLAAVVMALVGVSNTNPTKPADYSKNSTVAGQLNDQFTQEKQTYLDIVARANPREALDKLRADAQARPEILRSCHALTHEIGRAAYQKYGSFAEAIKYQDEICNSGYMHGVIEGNFSAVPDIEEAMKSTCNDYPIGKYQSWECYHGIGHGLMYYSNNDLPKSVSMCDGYSSRFAQSACANGVFMENFNTDQKLHPSQYLNASDFFYPCASQSSKHKPDCYFYAPVFYLSMHPEDYKEALAVCTGAERGYASFCAQGVGGQAAKENISDPVLVEQACNGSGAGMNKFCIYGLVGTYAFHFGDLASAEALCPKLSDSDKKICENFTAVNRQFFN